MANFWEEENKEDELDLLAQNTMYPEAEQKASDSIEAEIQAAAEPIFAPEMSIEQEELASITSPPSPELQRMDRMQGLLAELQKQRAEQQQRINLGRGANQIAQAFASGRGAKIGTGNETLDAIEKTLDQPIKDYQARIDNEMDEPTSDVSKFYREQAYSVLRKLKPDGSYDGKLENMSANQLLKLPGLKNVLESQTKQKAYQKTDLLTEPINGKRYNLFADVNNAENVYRNETGEIVPYRGQTTRQVAYIDPKTGNRGYYAEGSAPAGFVRIDDMLGGNVSQPKPTEDKSKKQDKKIPTVGEYRQSGVITPLEWRDVVQKDKEGFEAANSAKMGIISSLDAIDSQIELAKTNSNAAKTLGPIIGSLFDPGKQTDEDAKRFIGQMGLWNIASNWVTQAATGKIDKDMAKEISETAKNYKVALDGVVRKNAENYANNTLTGLMGGSQINPNSMADFYYQRKYASKDSPAIKKDKSTINTEEIKRKTSDGRIAIFDKNKKFLRYEDETK